MTSETLLQGGNEMVWSWDTLAYEKASEVDAKAEAAREAKRALLAKEAALLARQAEKVAMNKRNRRKADDQDAKERALEKQEEAGAQRLREQEQAKMLAANEADPEWVRERRCRQATEDSVGSAIRRALLDFADAAIEVGE